jgi:hypothetical protein
MNTFADAAQAKFIDKKHIALSNCSQILYPKTRSKIDKIANLPVIKLQFPKVNPIIFAWCVRTFFWFTSGCVGEIIPLIAPGWPASWAEPCADLVAGCK